ncbi:hypothetical protein NDU88_003329 [Pleurodeles waltl]|uniref:Uncharacterized protein n=1 Tax=Pleurodeles waltl TaxID=8319 RepID=A0AAV7TPD8_PLEWA|nr:hypothetical protein NDU88_003329 [Pleurodeles waltl]
MTLRPPSLPCPPPGVGTELGLGLPAGSEARCVIGAAVECGGLPPEGSAQALDVWGSQSCTGHTVAAGVVAGLVLEV